jgi:hypothetical protein
VRVEDPNLEKIHQNLRLDDSHLTRVVRRNHRVSSNLHGSKTQETRIFARVFEFIRVENPNHEKNEVLRVVEDNVHFYLVTTGWTQG